MIFSQALSVQQYLRDDAELADLKKTKADEMQWPRISLYEIEARVVEVLVSSQWIEKHGVLPESTDAH